MEGTGNLWGFLYRWRFVIGFRVIFFADLTKLKGKFSTNIAEIHNPCRVSMVSESHFFGIVSLSPQGGSITDRLSTNRADKEQDHSTFFPEPVLVSLCKSWDKERRMRWPKGVPCWKMRPL